MRWLLQIFAMTALGAAGYWSAVYYERAMHHLPQLQPPSDEQIQSLLSSEDDQQRATSAIRFEDAATKVGVDFAYYDGAEGLYFISETTGGGMGVLDYDNDGNRDLLFANGSRIPVNSADRTHLSQLYRQVDSGSFENVTAPSAAGVVSYGQGVAVGDFNNDGFEDALLSSFGSCHLLRNNGDGTFTEVSQQANVTTDRWGTSSAFADLDRDGDEDIYVCTYAELDIDDPVTCLHHGRRLHCHPQKYDPQPDLLFLNDGAGSFTEASTAVGAIDAGGRGLGLAIADFTGNDWPDIFVANDTSEAFLFINEEGAFREAGLEKGVALNGEGNMMAGMGVACADYDHNQWLDLYVTDYYEQKNALFENRGEAGFVDGSGPAGLAASSRDKLGWGAVFIDADLDGKDDLFVANGHVSDFGDRPYAMLQQFYQQMEIGRFEEVSSSAGLYFQRPMHGRGVAWSDFNNDGLADVVISHIRQQAALLLNRTTEHGHWIGLELVGVRSSRPARNVKLRVQVDGKLRIFETVAGSGYLSASDPRLIIGLGENTHIDAIELLWPSGVRQAFHPPAIDQYHLIKEPLQ